MQKEHFFLIKARMCVCFLLYYMFNHAAIVMQNRCVINSPVYWRQFSNPLNVIWILSYLPSDNFVWFHIQTLALVDLNFKSCTILENAPKIRPNINKGLFQVTPPFLEKISDLAVFWPSTYFFTNNTERHISY